jgi:hypothetical protein
MYLYYTQVNILAHSMGARVLMAAAPYLSELCEMCDDTSFATTTEYQQSPDGRNLVFNYCSVSDCMQYTVYA